jgi:hypothetical protein
MDSIVAAESTAAESTAAEREVASKLPQPINGPVDIEEGTPKVRTKLHLYTILLALYVSNTISVVECH